MDRMPGHRVAAGAATTRTRGHRGRCPSVALDAVSFQAPVQRLARQAQVRGGLGKHATVAVERSLDRGTIGLVGRGCRRNRRGCQVEVLAGDDIVPCQQGRPLHHVAQLAHVARPGVAQQGALGAFIQPLARGQEVARQRQDVARALRQRRQPQFDPVEPVEQVLAELHLRRSAWTGRRWSH